MGINTTCCRKSETNNESDFKVSHEMSSVINDKIEEFNFNNESLKEVKFAKNISDAFNFILSAEFYKSLIKGISPYILIGKITKNIFNSDLFKLFQKIVKWCKDYKSIENKYVGLIKFNLKLGTNCLIDEIDALNLKIINQNITIKKYLIKVITDVSLISHYFKYINENNTNEEYKDNFWKGVKVENEIKIYVYKISYSLTKFKKEIIENHSNNTTNERENINNINETIKIYKGVEKYINNIANKIISS